MSKWKQRAPRVPSPAAVRGTKEVLAKAAITTKIFKGLAPEGWMVEILAVRKGLPMDDPEAKKFSPIQTKSTVLDLLTALYGKP